MLKLVLVTTFAAYPLPRHPEFRTCLRCQAVCGTCYYGLAFALAARIYRVSITVTLCLCSGTLPELAFTAEATTSAVPFQETNLYPRSTGFTRQVALLDLILLLAQDLHATAGVHIRNFLLSFDHLDLAVLAAHPNVLLPVDLF